MQWSDDFFKLELQDLHVSHDNIQRLLCLSAIPEQHFNKQPHSIVSLKGIIYLMDESMHTL